MTEEKTKRIGGLLDDEAFEIVIALAAELQITLQRALNYIIKDFDAHRIANFSYSNPELISLGKIKAKLSKLDKQVDEVLTKLKRDSPQSLSPR